MIVNKSRSSLITIIIHILVWGVFGVLLSYQPLSWNIIVPVQFWIKQTIIIGFMAVAFYLNSFVLVPRFLLKNRTSVYFLMIICVATGIVMIASYMDDWLNLHHLMEEAFRHSGPPKRREGHHFEWDIAMIATTSLVLGISTSITAIQKWQKDRQVHQELEQDKISSELSFLKAQINPHFFFNTLNNIYALTLINGDTSRKAIHQLSRMMRYVLYDTQNATTLLSQEIAFVKDYISLMQLRLTEAVKIEFTSPAMLRDTALAPMIFLPFIENAFKHGVSATQPSYISINIDQEGATVNLKVVNTIIKEQSNNLEQGSGIGLNNTRRRLDLLYPGMHTLTIDENAAENIYSVHLTLDLS